jgi:hypothetical protein
VRGDGEWIFSHWLGSALYYMQYSDVPKLPANVHLPQRTTSLHLNTDVTYQLRARL